MWPCHICRVWLSRHRHQSLGDVYQPDSVLQTYSIDSVSSALCLMPKVHVKARSYNAATRSLEHCAPPSPPLWLCTSLYQKSRVLAVLICHYIILIQSHDHEKGSRKTKSNVVGRAHEDEWLIRLLWNSIWEKKENRGGGLDHKAFWRFWIGFV